MNPLTDESELIEAVKKGDSQAYQQLFENYQPMLYRAVLYRTRDERLAQDTVQDTFLKVWIHRDRLKSNLSFYSYLLKLSRNLVLDHYKREEVRTRYRDHVRMIEDRPNRDPGDDLEKKVLEARIDEVVNTVLPGKCREVFVLSRVEGLSNQEIADIMKVSKKTVENQLYRALKILRKKCESYL